MRRLLRSLARRLRGRPGRRPAWKPFLLAFWPFILGSALVMGGLAAIVVGYLGAAGTLVVGLQMPYLISGGLLGLALVVFGAALLLLHGLNRQARLLKGVLEEGRAASNGEASPTPNGLVLVPAGATAFHRPGCRLVEGKTARRLKPETAARKGLRPCPLCDPAAAS
jgi:hypothetical protein